MEEATRKATSFNSLLAILDSLPSGVDAFYDQTMSRINNQEPELALIAHRVFTILRHAAAKLSTEDVQYALASLSETGSFSKDDLIPIDVILGACAGLVEVRPRQELGEWNGPLDLTVTLDELGFIRE